VIGDDWIEQAFRFARHADPDARLFYNEVRADVPSAKHDALVGLIRDLRLRGVPVDGVGLQFHLTGRMPTQAQVDESIRGLADLGVDVHISEMDVPVWYLGSTIERKFQRQADVYRAVAAACNAQPACFRITTWGFTDRYTWRLPWAASLPLPFDSEYRPKPAWTAMQEVLRPPPSAAPPAAPAPATSVSAASAQPAAAPQAAAVAERPPLTLGARLRHQRLRTLLARRALAVVVGVSEPARVQLVARHRGRVIARVTVDAVGGPPASVRVALTATGAKRLRDRPAGRIVVSVVATDAAGRTSRTTTGMRVR
jgi:Glycosyl hydrolase family 10